jgi:GT2 family glycosyltransferase
LADSLQEIIRPVLELVGTGIEGVEHCTGLVEAGQLDGTFFALADDVRRMAETVKKAIAPCLQQVRKNALTELCDNIIAGIGGFAAVPAGGHRYPEFTFRNEVRAPVLGLYEALEHAFIIQPDRDKMRQFWDRRERLCVAARDLDVSAEMAKIQNAYDVTIVIMTFNMLEYFSQCLESVLRFTDFEKHKAQIIVFDHGSTDQTLEYLEKYADLDYLKIHHCKYNIKNELTFMTNHSTWYDTKYTLVAANDTVATYHYLENLLACAASDDRIAWICPSMSNTSNNQGIPVDYQTIEEMHAFAEKHNVSDRRKWVELSRLIPVFSMYSNVCMRAVYFTDPSYYEFFYADDDLSRSFLRAGFRILVCKDTYIHHYPSVTVHQQSNLGQRYYEMRQIFYDKYGYDAWRFQAEIAQNLHLTGVDLNQVQRVLFIEPNVGEAPQALKTFVRSQGMDEGRLEIYSVTVQPRYMRDLEGYSGAAALLSDYEDIAKVFPGTEFDLVVIPERLERMNIGGIRDFFMKVYQRMRDGGVMFFVISNMYHHGNIERLLTLSKIKSEFDPFENDVLKFLHINAVRSALQQCGFAEGKLTPVSGDPEPDALWQEIEGAVMRASPALDPSIYRFVCFLIRAKKP